MRKPEVSLGVRKEETSMAETVFRSKVESVAEAVPEATPSPTTPIDSQVELPYLDRTGKPFSADYFNLGDRWDDPEGGYGQEIAMIEDYFQDQIRSGEIANSQKAVEAKLKEIEKLHNLKTEERTVIKIGTIASYIKFLMETAGIKRTYKKYGHF